MPCMNALPPPPTRYGHGLMFAGDDEDYAHYMMGRMFEYDFIQALRVPVWGLRKKTYIAFMAPPVIRLDFLNLWPRISVPLEAYTDFTALRLERARFLAQCFENYVLNRTMIHKDVIMVADLGL